MYSKPHFDSYHSLLDFVSIYFLFYWYIFVVTDSVTYSLYAKISKHFLRNDISHPSKTQVSCLHAYLPIEETSIQQPVSSDPKMDIVERSDCILVILLHAFKAGLSYRGGEGTVSGSNQRLEQCFHMHSLHVWSTLVAFK